MSQFKKCCIVITTGIALAACDELSIPPSQFPGKMVVSGHNEAITFRQRRNLLASKSYTAPEPTSESNTVSVETVFWLFGFLDFIPPIDVSFASAHGYIDFVSAPDGQECVGSYLGEPQLIGFTEIILPAQIMCFDNVIDNLPVADKDLRGLIQAHALQNGWTELLEVTYLDFWLLSSLEDSNLPDEYIPAIQTLTGLEQLPSLTRLNLIFSPEPKPAKFVSSLTGLTDLQMFTFSSEPLSFPHGLNLSKNTQLVNLDLRRLGLKTLYLSSDHTRLVTLNLSSNNLTDISTLHLSRNHTELAFIYLDNNNLTDISSLLLLPNLERVDLSHNPNIPCEQLNELALKIGEGLIHNQTCD